MIAENQADYNHALPPYVQWFNPEVQWNNEAYVKEIV